MMTQASRFRVGVFVIAGLGLLLATLFWLGTSAYFQSYKVYVTYFAETVQGLDKDSPVKYLGVKVGRVSSIDLAPDGKLVEVIMHLDPKRQIESDMRCQLELTGITGSKFIQLVRLKPPMRDAAPKLAFQPRHPYIPSFPSLIENVVTAIQEMFRRFKKLDVKGVVDGVNKNLTAIYRIVNDPHWQKLAPSLVAITASLGRTALKIERILDERTLVAVRSDLKSTLKNLKRLSTRLNRQLKKLKLDAKGGKLLDNVNRLVADVGRELRLMRYSLRQTSRNLDRASSDLRGLIEQVKRQPSQLLWGDPPKDRFPGAK